MPIDLQAIKGATLSDDHIAQIQAALDELTSQRDAARQESINGRVGQRAKLNETTEKLTQLQRRNEAMAERLGIDPDSDLSELPDVKGMAEAGRQYEARLKRFERDHAEALKRAESAEAARVQLLRDVQIGRALSGQKFRNPDDVKVLIGTRVVTEGDDLLFKTDDGRLVPLDDGVAWFAKTRPDYVEAAPVERGSGFKGATGPGGGSAKSMTSAEFGSLAPKQRAAVMAEGYQITD